MLKIGEFSKLSRVTVKTLHHYDELDLLKPISVDPLTSYRYYNVDQLLRVHRIIALKELGLSLEQIKLMLEDDIPIEQMRGMLYLKQAESQQRMRAEQERLQQIEFRLRMIDMEGQMPKLDVVIKEIPALHALTLRRTMQPQEMIPFGLEVENAIVANKVVLTGPATEIRYEEEFRPIHEDVEFVWPVSTTHTKSIPLETFGTLQPRQIDGLPQVASFMIHGMNPTRIMDTMSIFRRWIVDNGYQLCPTHRLVFHNGPTEHAEYEDWIIEFQHEIMPAETE